MNEVTYNGHFYEVGGWSFDESDKDIAYIDQALEAWSRWRDYVVAEQDVA
jgi:hypothetical protein